MKKDQFKTEIKKVNFEELKRLNPKMETALKSFTIAVSPEVLGKQDDDDVIPHEGEFPQEVQDIMGLFFDQLPEKYPSTIIKPPVPVKSPMQKKLETFRMALKYASTEEDRKVLERKIKTFETAIKFETGN